MSLVLGCATANAAPPGSPFDRLLDRRPIGAHAFTQEHPSWDGRGVVIAVLDTGVDMGVAGLTTVPTGGPKVIDVRDFSGQGIVTLSDAEELQKDGTAFLKSSEVTVTGYAGIPRSTGGALPKLGVLRESAFQNSDVQDLNGDGDGNDEFAVAVVATEKGRTAYVDLSGDLDLADAKPIRSYGVAQETFSFRLRSPTTEKPPLTIALHLDDDGDTVQFHFDDGGHGSHVAGIAAGFGLMGRTGYDGVAPGAHVLSLKIGDNTLSGGATTTDAMRRALEFAGRWSADKKVLVVANISYGISSEREGRTDIDTLTDELLAKYPMLVVATSAGNEGPGLSTIGTPAGAQLATAVAAMMPRETAETLFGSGIKRDLIFSFSSRGGEVAKPDLLAPGVASSTTPEFDDGDIKAGTSMAAPQVTGFYALVGSAAVAQKVPITNTILKRAALASAEPMHSYSLLEQGAGIPNAARAWKHVQAMSRSAEPFRVAGYRVSSPIPTAPGLDGAAAYFRAGTWLPDDDEGHRFQVEPIFFDAGKGQDGFQQVLSWRSEASWISVDRKDVRFRGGNPESIVVRYDAEALREPGVYTGRVVGTPDDAGGVPAVALWTTVVVPHQVDAAGGYGLTTELELDPGEHARVPVLVPPGATSLQVDLSALGFAECRLYAFDPEGHPRAPISPSTSSRSGTTASFRAGEDALDAGTWELVVVASAGSRRASKATLDVQFRALDFDPIRSWSLAPGEHPKGSVKVVNRFDTRFDGRVSGEVVGYRREHDLDAAGDTASESYSLNADIERVDFVLRLAPEVHARFTDVAIGVFDASGNAVVKDGFMSGTARISVPAQGLGSGFRLQIQGARASGDKNGDGFTIRVEETWVRKSPIAIPATELVLYPSVPAVIDFELQKTPPRAPDGYVTYGSLTLLDGVTDSVWAEIPILVE
ncbi:MAG: S8 family serine peptidase [Myxococcales bacterium]|nr:S8 family serine peptidase [Myxococcales bacterium]